MKFTRTRLIETIDAALDRASSISRIYRAATVEGA